MAATRMTRAEAEALVQQVRDETTLRNVAVARRGSTFRVQAVDPNACDPTPTVFFDTVAAFAAYPDRDPGLPARRKAEAELRYRQRDLVFQGSHIKSEGEALVKILRRVAADIEASIARADAALVIPDDRTPTERQIAKTRAYHYEVLARQIVDELDWINPTRINRMLGDRRVDLATAKASLLALLPADGDDD